MVIIKRNGEEVAFDISKIENAIKKANNELENDESRLSDNEINSIALNVKEYAESSSRSLHVEEIQDLVEEQIMKYNKYKLLKTYITYRYKRQLIRKANTTDESILNIVDCNNEDVKQENSNKNPIINSTQRDYIAGEVSKDITKRLLLPEKIVKAHEAGIIHFHDSDYYLQYMTNCCLVNIKDMLQNTTVISETLIETPQSFQTACNVTTQIIAQVASSQYGRRR